MLAYLAVEPHFIPPLLGVALLILCVVVVEQVQVVDILVKRRVKGSGCEEVGDHVV